MTESTFIEPSPEEALDAFKSRINKKGNRSWKPGNQLSLTEQATEQLRKNGLHYRWVSRQDGEIGRRLDQGFAFANRITGAPIEGSAENPTIPGTTPTRHDLVGMVTTIENVQAYRAAMHGKVEERERTITQRAAQSQRDQFGVSNVYGKTEVKRQRLEID